MKYFIILITLLLSIASADIKIVASSSCKVDILSNKEVKDLFLGKKKTINAEPIVVADSSEKKIYKKFAKEYIHKSLRKMKTYWVRMLFTGKKIPPKKFSLQELSTLDSQNSCYISYMEEEKIPTNWKEISIK